MSEQLQRVTFRNGEIDVAGDLRFPDERNAGPPYAPLVIATPGSSVKGQIGANYARRLTARGYVTLTFDPSYQGQSGGYPRDQEDPATRVEDIRCAVDFLTTVDRVDADRIGLVGVCAGGGYAASAAMTEHRIRALGLVVPVNIGRTNRQGDGSDPDRVARTLEAVGRQRTVEAGGGEEHRVKWIPDSAEEARAGGRTDRDLFDAIEFYRTPRGFDQHSTNRRLFRSSAAIIGFDAFHLAEELLVQPLQVVVGGRRGSTGSFEDGLLVWERARNSAPLHVIDGAGHYDLYDKQEYVDPAVERLAAFFGEHLGRREPGGSRR